MNRYAILNSRKRAVIALVHSFAFGMLAFYQLLVGQRPSPLLAVTRSHYAGPAAMSLMYLVVTVVLLSLTLYSRNSLERLYFVFCSTSAGVGLLRVVFGDPTLHFEALLRVLMLGCAVLTGMLIYRQHASRQPQFAD